MLTVLDRVSAVATDEELQPGLVENAVGVGLVDEPLDYITPIWWRVKHNEGIDGGTKKLSHTVAFYGGSGSTIVPDMVSCAEDRALAA